MQHLIRKQFVALSAFLLLSTGCSDKIKPAQVEVKRPVVSGVTVKSVSQERLPELYETTGTVKSKTTSVVSAKIMGVINQITVKEGDFVKKGDVIISLDDSDIALRVKSASKALDVARQNKSLAETTLARYQSLYDEKALSGQELDQMKTQRNIASLEYERAEAMFQEANVHLGYTKITAPITGIVSSKKADVGSMAMPGQPLLVIEGTDSYQVEASVDESLFKQIKIGHPVTMSIDALGKDISATITEIVPSIEPSSRSFIVKIATQSTGIKPGQFVRVKIPIGSKDVILVPSKAIAQKGQLTGVYAIGDKNIITYRLVKLGKSIGSNVEVLSGLKPGEKIIVDGVSHAVDGGVLSEGQAK